MTLPDLASGRYLRRVLVKRVETLFHFAGGRPGIAIIRNLAPLWRTLAASWFSGESYQRLAASILGNSSIAIQHGAAASPSSIVFSWLRARYRAPYFGRISRASSAYSCCIASGPVVAVLSTITNAGRSCCAADRCAKHVIIERAIEKLTAVSRPSKLPIESTYLFDGDRPDHLTKPGVTKASTPSGRLPTSEPPNHRNRSEEHTSELQSHSFIS